MVPPWGRGSNSKGITYGRNVLSDDSGGCKSRHGDGGSGGHSGGGSGGWRCSGGGSRAWVGAADRGRRRLPHSRPKTMSFARLHHGWAREGEEMERLGGREVSEMILE